MAPHQLPQRWHLILIFALLLVSSLILYGLKLKHQPAVGQHEGQPHLLDNRGEVTDDDTVAASLTFDVKFDAPVAMHIDDTSRFTMDEDGAKDYAALIPPEGHIVHMTDGTQWPPKKYTVTLFHQLRCLGAIHRLSMKAPTSQPTSLDHHCMNYIRQSVLCRPNLRIEPVKNIVGTGVRAYDAVCRDWSKIYEEAARNRMEFRKLNGSRMDDVDS